MRLDLYWIERLAQGTPEAQESYRQARSAEGELRSLVAKNTDVVKAAIMLMETHDAVGTILITLAESPEAKLPKNVGSYEVRIRRVHISSHSKKKEFSDRYDVQLIQSTGKDLALADIYGWDDLVRPLGA